MALKVPSQKLNWYNQGLGDLKGFRRLYDTGCIGFFWRKARSFLVDFWKKIVIAQTHDTAANELYELCIGRTLC